MAESSSCASQLFFLTVPRPSLPAARSGPRQPVCPATTATCHRVHGHPCSALHPIIASQNRPLQVPILDVATTGRPVTQCSVVRSRTAWRARSTAISDTSQSHIRDEMRFRSTAGRGRGLYCAGCGEGKRPGGTVRGLPRRHRHVWAQRVLGWCTDTHQYAYSPDWYGR